MLAIWTPESGNSDLWSEFEGMNAIGFAERLRGMVLESASERAFAREVGIPQGTLRGLLAGKSPTLETLIAIASAKGVEYRWLATGEGPQKIADALALAKTSASTQPGAFDPELLARVVDRIARVYRDEGVRLQDMELGRLAAERYAEIIELAGDADEWPALLDLIATRVRKAIRAAAADPANIKREA